MARDGDRGRVIFIGGVHEAEPVLRGLLECAPDAGADVVAVFTLSAQAGAKVSGPVDLAPLAQRSGVPVHRVDNVNDPDVVERIRGLRPDLIVCAGWTRLLKDALLRVPARGCVGFHASMLPKHRGRAPVNWAILRGETRAGNTMFMLDPEADTGDIIDQRAVPIAPDATCADVYAAVAAAGAEMLRTNLRGLLDGTAPRIPQPISVGEPLPKRTPAMGITDWNRPARGIHDWIRALTAPYPGAFTFIGERKVMLWRSLVPAADEVKADPGHIVSCDATGVRVGTRHGSIVITEMSDAGCDPQSAHTWFQSSGLQVGECFDAVDPAVSRWAQGLGPMPAETEVTLTGVRRAAASAGS
jgi:methionyl-tRNA formyltransferase